MLDNALPSLEHQVILQSEGTAHFGTVKVALPPVPATIVTPWGLITWYQVTARAAREDVAEPSINLK